MLISVGRLVHTEGLASAKARETGTCSAIERVGRVEQNE